MLLRSTEKRMAMTGRMIGGTLMAALMMMAGSASAAVQAGDPVKGKTLFAKCIICHTVEPGKNKLGPSLAGVVGRKAGSVAGFNYSPAMKGAGIVWSPDNLDKYITNPRTLIPGNKMIFAGMANPADRANLIAYLQKPDAAK